MYEVHLFSAEATAQQPVGRYRPGDRHAMVVFVRQAIGTDHDWAKAESGIEEAGWDKITIERAGTLSAENLNGKSPEFAAAFEHAMLGACGMVVYEDPIPGEAL